MPIYTVAILVFFIYTIVKILFKNKNNEEEEEDEEFLNSEYYKNCIAQNSSKKNTVTGGKTSSLTQQNCQEQKTIGDPTLKKYKPEEDTDRKQRQNQNETSKESKKTVSFDLHLSNSFYFSEISFFYIEFLYKPLHTFFFAIFKFGILMFAICAKTVSNVFSVCSSFAFNNFISMSPKHIKHYVKRYSFLS